jgi:hypothetical protein
MNRRKQPERLRDWKERLRRPINELRITEHDQDMNEVSEEASRQRAAEGEAHKRAEAEGSEK